MHYHITSEVIRNALACFL